MEIHTKDTPEKKRFNPINVDEIRTFLTRNDLNLENEKDRAIQAWLFITVRRHILNELKDLEDLKEKFSS